MNKNIIKLFAILVMCFMICAVLVACSSTQGAQGPKGDKGDSIKGDKGDPGEDGTVVTVGDDGYLYLDGEKTDVKVKGEDATECTLPDHDWQIETLRPHTQDKPGVDIGICSDCGDAKWFIDEHKFTVEYEVVDPTCTVDGYIEYACSECGVPGGEKYTEVVPAHGHKHEAVVTAPTCTAKGYTTHTCTVCGNTYQDTEVEALGHSFAEWDENNIDLTVWTLADREDLTLNECLAHDTYITVCARGCGEKHKENTTPTGHDYESSEWVMAEKDVEVCDCLYEQIWVRACANNCGGEKEHKKDAPKGHSWGEWEITLAPTATAAGSIKRTCANDCEHCGGHCVETKELPALSTADAYSVVTVDPTCTATGKSTYTYIADPEITIDPIEVELDKLPHDYATPKWEVVTEPTATETGKVEFYCNDCNEPLSMVLPVLGDAAYTVTAGKCSYPHDKYEITLVVDGADVVVNFEVDNNYAHSFPTEETLKVEGEFYIYTVRYCSECDDYVVIHAELK